MKSNIRFFEEISLNDVSTVGGKNASLGELYQYLRPYDIRIPNGFAIMVSAYSEYMIYNNCLELGEKSLKKMENDRNNLVLLSLISQKLKKKIIDGKFPVCIEKEIKSAYLKLSESYSMNLIDVAVRSSSISEDSKTNSYAGQQDTYLNIRGYDDLITHIKLCYASMFNERAISYRFDKGDSIENMKMSVCIQKMVRSDMGTSGVAFTIDPESGFRDCVIINASYGLGELIVGGLVEPDEYIVFKKTDSIIDKKIGKKQNKLIYGSLMSGTLEIKNTEKEMNSFCLNDEQILQISSWAKIIEKHYQIINNNLPNPMDIEWAIDGLSNELFIVQARPETVISQKNYSMIELSNICVGQTKTKILSGTAVGEKIAVGNINIIDSIDQMIHFKKGQILVVDSTSPDWEPIMKLSSGIITNKGGRTCHAAIIAREQGIPAIVGTGNATEILKNNDLVTICCNEGETGFIYEGSLSFDVNQIDLSKLPICKNTKIMFNLASPEIAFKTSMYPNAGVGLAREEFIINNFIKVHPLALLNYDNIPIELKIEIDQLIIGYENCIDYYINKLAYGIAKIGAAFYPNDVILRFSDFKSNEYRNLLGGSLYEPNEENPMIGWRGASRYYSEKFEKAFGLECLAIKKVREEMGLKNVIVMIPFCRTPQECSKVYEVMEKYGLKRGINDLQVYLMCEIPSNVLLAKQFCQLIDGFSIGSNDLTQLILGLDRDSHLVSHIYDERNEAVKKMIKKVINVAHKNNTKIGICGQAPSDFPDFVEFLLENKIDSISITPDSIIKVINTINKIENKI